jgi:hypothetical protein
MGWGVCLGCIPGARHTNNKKIFEYLKSQTKKKHFDVYPLCEVYDIEPLTTGTYNYKVYYTDYGARDWKQASFNWNVGSKSYKLDVRLFRLIDNGKKKTIECKKLVLAAGAIGSTEILLKATNTTRTTGQKLDLSTSFIINIFTLSSVPTISIAADNSSIISLFRAFSTSGLLIFMIAISLLVCVSSSMYFIGTDM